MKFILLLSSLVALLAANPILNAHIELKMQQLNANGYTESERVWLVKQTSKRLDWIRDQ
jgi:hypothetical protein